MLTLHFPKEARRPPLSIAGARPEVVPEMLQRALDRERRHPAKTAQGALQHRLTQVLEQLHVPLALHPAQDAVDDFHSTGRAYAARRALATGLDRAELHRITGHPRHIDGIVENDEAAVAQQSADSGERLVVDGRIELGGRNVGPERSADLNRSNRPAAGRAPAVVIKNL